MRKLVLILIAFIAVITFIRAFDNSGAVYSDMIRAEQVYSGGIDAKFHSGSSSAVSGETGNTALIR